MSSDNNGLKTTEQKKTPYLTQPVIYGMHAYRSLEPQVRFRTYFEFQGNGWTMYWQVQPDGRYWGDDGGFGIENDEEVILQASVDMDGCFTGPFRIYSMGSEKY